MLHPLSNESLKNWLKKQSGEYTYSNPWNCLLAQYLKSVGFSDVSVGAYVFMFTSLWVRKKDLPPGWDKISSTRPHTFEAALERLEKL